MWGSGLRAANPTHLVASHTAPRHVGLPACACMRLSIEGLGKVGQGSGLGLGGAMCLDTEHRNTEVSEITTTLYTS